MSDSERRGVIFDLDGVLVDSSRWHREALERLGERIGVPVTGDFHHATFGMRTYETIRRLLPQPPSDAAMAELVEKKEALFRDIARGNLCPLPGSVHLVRELRRAGFRLAIGSSTVRENVALVLNELGIADAFDAILAGEDVRAGKPDPEVFLAAARKLDLDPSRCVVIEDAVAGVEAARRAGMRVIAVSTSHPSESLAHADRVVGSLRELSPGDIRVLLDGSSPS